MLAILASTLFLVGVPDGPLPNAAQLRDLIHTRAAPLSSLVLVYEGSKRWVGDPKLSPNPRGEEADFQGTFLYRRDGAAYCDVYSTNFSNGQVVREKGALFRGQIQASRRLSNSKEPANDGIESYPGFLGSLIPWAAPIDFMLEKELEGRLETFFCSLAAEGWEMVSGRNCLRVVHSTFAHDQDQDKERSKRIYWIDLERNAQVLKVEYYQGGRMIGRVDDIQLIERPLKNGSPYWLPVHARRRIYIVGEQVTSEPVSEQILAMTAGTELIDVDLPDSLFSITRNAAYPTPDDLKGVVEMAEAAPLARQFRTQTPSPPQRRDPVSVHQQVQKSLAEADRQSKELEASSPARQAWSTTNLIQIAVGVTGLILLGAIAARRLGAA